MNELRRVSRRAFLLGAAATLAACDTRRPREGLLGFTERVNERVERALFSPHRLAPELPEHATSPTNAFPTYYISPAPPGAPRNWRLDVSGMVARPQAFTLEALQRLSRTDLRVRHHCVEGWSAVASWHGVRLRELAELVGADAHASYVEFRSFDMGYYSSWDRESALHPQTILAYGMNGAPLTPGYGAPLRLYSSVKLGYKMVKYLTQITFLPIRTGGYWEDRGYEWYAGV
jgi:DMSO/TMAO reductase YedYZ molybdopterin-dependent catalytic subunit